MNILDEIIRSFRPDQSGYLFMWILAAIAFVALLVILERWIQIGFYSNVNAAALMDRISELIKENKLPEAEALCRSGSRRPLPSILLAGIQRFQAVPDLFRSAMEEQALHIIPRLEKRLSLIAVTGNIATLLGLMGTIYGLIIAFAAVAQPDVSPAQKSSMLATGISAAMNTTLLGLVVAVPCVLAYSMLRSRVDEILAEIDRYVVALIRLLTPENSIQKSYKISTGRVKEEVELEPNMVPFMNLMVVLIPLLLSSSEFIKIGMIEIKLPESAQGVSEGGGNDAQKDAKLDLGVVINSKGFNIFHYFKQDTVEKGLVEIPLINGEYDFTALNLRLADIKKKVLQELIRTVKPDLNMGLSLEQLYILYTKNNLSRLPFFSDHQNVKIVAEDKIKYQTVIAVMDAARGTSTQAGKVPLFPNVSIAGGIIQ
ncbi:MAG TPA: MotA/TolQ/ExbB proton channel family protein [Chitinispirillaceae bacterium]|nr:MotA/TolQ/ExbB proton channel family protein [Chitinispirillaceae bacterium]